MNDFVVVPWEFSLIRYGNETAGEIEISVDVAYDEYENIEIQSVQILLRGNGDRWVAAEPQLSARISKHLLDDQRFLDVVDEKIAEQQADLPARIGDARYEDSVQP